MNTVVLFHNHFDKSHLEEVKAEMVKRGAPVIRCIWSEVNGVWLAVEGCHRLRAAQALGITPVIKDITGNKFANIQMDDKTKKVQIAKLLADLEDDAWKRHIIDF